MRPSPLPTRPASRTSRKPPSPAHRRARAGTETALSAREIAPPLSLSHTRARARTQPFQATTNTEDVKDHTMLDVLNEATLLENTKKRFMTARRGALPTNTPAQQSSLSLTCSCATFSLGPCRRTRSKRTSPRS